MNVEKADIIVELDKIADLEKQRWEHLAEHVKNTERLSGSIREANQKLFAELDAENSAIAEIDGEFDRQIADLREIVVAAVSFFGETVKGRAFMAVFSKRVSWDNKQLEALRRVYPALDGARSESTSVAIRAVKEK